MADGVGDPRRARARASAGGLRGLKDVISRAVAYFARPRREDQALKIARQEVTTLLRRLVNAQEVERGRIARDLHDQLGQQLTALRLALERVQERPGPAGPTDEAIAQALALTRQIGRDIDFLAWELRPGTLDELGLAAALPRLVREWSAHVGVAGEVRFGGFEPGQLARDAEVAFYRVAQEALNNVAKHARATRVDVVLATSQNHVTLVVEDDGVGFEPDGRAGNGAGLAGMRERALLAGATLQIESTPGKGTAIYLRRPVSAVAADEAT